MEILIGICFTLALGAWGFYIKTQNVLIAGFAIAVTSAYILLLSCQIKPEK